jgi:methylmalonyl-CoA decarboxylase subunit alpha
MSHQEKIDELNHRKELARQMGGQESVAKQHSLGKLTVRERIELLLDEGSFNEMGILAGIPEYKDGELKTFLPDNAVTGIGRIDGREVCVNGSDWTTPGLSSGAGGGKTCYIERMALDWRMPVIRLLDAGGTRLTMMENIGHAVIPANPELPYQVQLMAQVPVVSAVLGSAGGWVGVMAALSHWNVMTKSSAQLFIGGTPLIKRALNLDITKEELGNYKVHAERSGVVHNVAENEQDAFDQIKRFLSYLPTNVWEQPPCIDSHDDPQRRENGLLSIVPENPGRAFDMKKLINMVVDKDSVFEIGPLYGRSLITCLARMNGIPVAVMGNSRYYFGGAQTAAACDKMTRFVDLADTFHLPVIYFVDVPGFMIGPDSELEGTLRRAARTAVAIQQATTPWLGVIVGRCYGVAGWFHKNEGRTGVRYAWTTARWGSLPIAGGALAAHSEEIKNAADPEKKLKEIEQRLDQMTSPFRTAEAFGVEEIIDPRDTRPLLCNFVKMSRRIGANQLGPKLRYGIRP